MVTADAVKCAKSGLFACLDAIQRAMCEALAVPVGSECRLWMKSSESSCERLRNMHMSVLDACLSTGMVRSPFATAHSRTETKASRRVCVCACVCVCARACFRR